MAGLLPALLDRASGHPRPAAARGGCRQFLPTPEDHDPGRRRKMSDTMTLDAYGSLIEPATLKIQRLLPGPIDRVWAYLTDGDLRRQWLAAGAMNKKPGTSFEFVWRNDELTDPPGQRPAHMPEEHRMT